MDKSFIPTFHWWKDRIYFIMNNLFKNNMTSKVHWQFQIGKFPVYFNTKMYVEIQLKFSCSIETLEKKCEICSKLTIKHQNNVIDVILMFLLLTMNIFHTFSSVSIVDFEQVNVSWDVTCLNSCWFATTLWVQFIPTCHSITDIVLVFLLLTMNISNTSF